MAVSFTAEYLFQGAQFLRRDPNGICPEALLVVGRGLYSAGLLAVSPVGVLWHACAAAYRALAQRCAADGAEVQALNTRMWQDLYAARNDLLGAGLILLNSFMLACVVAAYVFLEPVFLCVPVYALCHAYLEDQTDLIIPYYFGVHPITAFSQFLSGERADGAQFSQRDEYLAYYMYNPMVREGLATGQPLTPAEIIELRENLNNLIRNRDVIGNILLGPTFLKKQGRIAPDAAARVDALLAKDSELREALHAAIVASRNQPAESRDRFIAEHFAERMSAIVNTLPPLGAQAQPAPAV